jgi:hypothetical protein
VRYWHNGEDEHFEREMDRVRRFGGLPPAPISLAEKLLIIGLSVGEAILFAGSFAALLLR